MSIKTYAKAGLLLAALAIVGGPVVSASGIVVAAVTGVHSLMIA